MTHRGVFVCVWGCVLAVLTVSLPVHADANLVQTTYGPVQGFQWLEVDQFLGIPFASPPVNDLRFKAPIPPKSWTSVKDVTTYPPICPQVRITGQWVIGQEDCLYLNMYRPHMSSNVSTELLPVMVWIYGGGVFSFCVFVSDMNKHVHFNVCVACVFTCTDTMFVNILSLSLCLYVFVSLSQVTPLATRTNSGFMTEPT